MSALQDLQRPDEKEIYSDTAVAGEITRLAFTVRREILRETRPLGITPFEAARSSIEVASFSVFLTASASLAVMAAVSFFMAVLTAEFTARFRSRRFCACRSLLSADG